MKTTMTWLLGLAMVLLSGHVLANAKVFSMTGTVSAATGPAPAQPVKVGDTIRAGQTAITAANSTVVLQFPDGHLASLTPNSRMTIEAYQYNEQAKSGNVLLALISGGMRAVTGLIGRTSPDKVSYKAATATIGIRGTDVTLAVAGTSVVMTVNGGVVSFSFPGQPAQSVNVGNAVVVNTTTGAVTIASIQAVVNAIAATNPTLAAAVQTTLTGTFTATITSAATSNTTAVSTITVTPPATTTNPTPPPVTVPVAPASP